MENMIKKIVDADNEAKAMEADTLKEKEELSRKIEDETKAIYQKYMNDAAEQIKRNDIQEEKKVEKQLEELQNKQKSAHIKLQSDFKQNCDNWVNTIYNRVIG